MKGTTGQKRRTKQTKNKTPGAHTHTHTRERERASERHGPELHLPQWRLVLFPSLDSFQPKRCTKIWHDKRRENETIPIWNLIVALAENSESQWSCFSLNALGKKLGKAYHITQIFPKTQLTYRSQERCQVSLCYFELFLGIINTWKNPRIWSPWIFLYRTWQ